MPWNTLDPETLVRTRTVRGVIVSETVGRDAVVAVIEGAAGRPPPGWCTTRHSVAHACGQVACGPAPPMGDSALRDWCDDVVRHLATRRGWRPTMACTPTSTSPLWPSDPAVIRLARAAS